MNELFWCFCGDSVVACVSRVRVSANLAQARGSLAQARDAEKPPTALLELSPKRELGFLSELVLLRRDGSRLSENPLKSQLAFSLKREGLA